MLKDEYYIMIVLIRLLEKLKRVIAILTENGDKVKCEKLLAVSSISNV